MNKHFTEEATWMENKPIKICSTSFSIKEIQIKTKNWVSVPPTKITKIEKKNCGNTTWW